MVHAHGVQRAQLVEGVGFLPPAEGFALLGGEVGLGGDWFEHGRLFKCQILYTDCTDLTDNTDNAGFWLVYDSFDDDFVAAKINEHA
jgi:hypothetical protein